MWNILIIILVVIVFVLAFAVTNKYFKASLNEYVSSIPRKTTWGLWKWAVRHEKHAVAMEDADRRHEILLENAFVDTNHETPPGKSKIMADDPRTSHKPRKGI